MNFREELYRLFCVPKCPSCNAFLKRGETVLCRDCMSKYLGEKVQACSFCFQDISKCSCTPKTFKKAKIRHLFKISRYYSKREDSPTKQLIFSLKKDNLRKVIDFMAQEIADRLIAFYGEDISNIVIIPIPRRKSNVIKYGYDHASKLARKVSKKLRCKFVLALKSNTKMEQKGLTRKERHKNVKFALNKKINLQGARIVILDDIVTSGASMLEASKLLFQLQPNEISGVCFAISYNDIDLNADIPF